VCPRRGLAIAVAGSRCCPPVRRREMPPGVRSYRAFRLRLHRGRALDVQRARPIKRHDRVRFHARAWTVVRVVSALTEPVPTSVIHAEYYSRGFTVSRSVHRSGNCPFPGRSYGE
jgi:hypothetical protein